MLIDDIPHQPVVRRRLDAEATTMSDSLQPDDQVPQLLHFDHKDTVFYGKHQGKSEKDTKKKPRLTIVNQGSHLKKTAASYSPALHCSTIGAGGLNFSVRNGKRWDPAAITT